MKVTFEIDPNADTTRHLRAHSGTQHHRYGNAADHGHTYTDAAAGPTFWTVARYHRRPRRTLLRLRP